MQAVILAAGKGSRLSPLTENRSKAMLPVLGKPITERVLESLAANGIKDFIIVASPSDHELMNYFLHKSPFKDIVKLASQSQPLGTANALLGASPWINGDFILSSCDNLLSAADVARMLACWKGNPHPNAVLALMEMPSHKLKNSSAVEFQDDWVSKIVEKPTPNSVHANIACLPIYCLPKSILDFLPDVPISVRGEYEIQDAIQMLIDRVGYVGGIMVEDRLSLTHSADLLNINKHYLASNKFFIHQEARRVGSDTQLFEPIHIEYGVIIGANCKIGPYVYIERDCQIGSQVIIRDSVILRESVIHDGAEIVNQVIVDSPNVVR